MERKIKLFIAQSLDGYIARQDGGLDWLHAIPNPDKDDHGYGAFIAGIDLIIMGRKTYAEVLGFDVPWPYEQETWVVSRGDVATETPSTVVVNDWEKEVRKALSEPGKDIWLVGGGQLITEFLHEGLIDEMLISIIPVILGDGIPLFPDNPLETYFELISNTSYKSGVVNISYRRVDRWQS